MIFVVADDRVDNAQSLCAALEMMGGHTAIPARNVRHAIDQCVSARPDVLVLDWVMPAGGGKAVLAELDAKGARPAAVIVLTGYDDTLDIELDSMGLSHLLKPQDAAAVATLAQRLLGAKAER